MAHQGPRRDKLTIKLDSSHEVQHALLMISSETIVVANDAAAFRPVLVVLEHAEGEMG